MDADFALEPLNFPALDAAAMVELAAEAGYRHVSLALINPITGTPDIVVQDRAARERLVDRLAALSLTVCTIEVANLTPGVDPASFEPMLACAADLGARSVTVIFWEYPDRDEAVAAFRQLAAIARTHGVRLNIEFFPSCLTLPSLNAAIAFLDAAGCPDAGVVVDILHLVRSGSSLERMQAVRDRIGGAQLCDGPADCPYDDLLIEAGRDRWAPGTGAFPTQDFLDALPSGTVIGLEAPQAATQDGGDRIGRALDLRDRARAILSPSFVEEPQ